MGPTTLRQLVLCAVAIRSLFLFYKPSQIHYIRITLKSPVMELYNNIM